MFTLDQIAAAHSKVKSGKDFPAYIAEIKKLGVVRYNTFVTDGHTEYAGSGGITATSAAKYEPLHVAHHANASQFRLHLKAHQDGQSDYATFCRQAAEAGVEKWRVDIAAMTCTYYDKAGNEILVERIHQ